MQLCEGGDVVECVFMKNDNLNVTVDMNGMLSVLLRESSKEM